MVAWNGAKSYSSDNQAYYTNNELASQVITLAKRYKGPYVELGVGNGALFQGLPDPKQGVEIQNLSPKLQGVCYNANALTWKPSRRAGVVVMNPPFAQQAKFFNHASTFTDTIIWIAGLNIRLWTNEDGLDPYMHLEKEWLVPPEWSTFSTKNGPVNVRTVVQVWKRKNQARVLWNLQRTITPCKNQQSPHKSAIIVKRVGAPKDVGKSVPFIHCKIISRNKYVTQTSNGTLIDHHHGSAMAFDKELPNLLRRHQSGVIHDLMRNRTFSKTLCSLSLPVLSAITSPNWRRLIRPIQYMDGRSRDAHQW